MSTDSTAAQPPHVWGELIDRYVDSGLTQRAFCKLNDLSYDAFGYHYRKSPKFQSKRRKRRQPTAASSAPSTSAFRPVRTSGPDVLSSGALAVPSLVVRVDGRYAIECSPGSDLHVVAELARAIAR